MFSLLLITIALLSQNQVFSSPVLLWSTANLPQSPISYSSISPQDIISNQICKLTSERVQIRLFAVHELTNEDIQRGSQSKHPVLLDAKKDQSQYRYFPNVAGDVYKTFSLIPQSNNAQCSNIHFQITSSEVYQTSHDGLNAMKASIDSIGDNSNTVILMALVSDSVAQQSLARQRRQVEDSGKDVIISEDQSCMFYADKLHWGNVGEQDPSAGNYSLDINDSACTPQTAVTPTANVTSAVLELTWTNGTSDKIKMILMANITGRYWYLEKAIINDSEYRYFAYGMHSRMDTPPSFSYVCTTALFVKYNSSTKYGTYDFQDKFYITNFQFQPFQANNSIFGQPNYCTSFFTSGIWMGITSSLLCLGIALFGIHRLMSIRSNDRFDDPKGKPLIIKASE